MEVGLDGMPQREAMRRRLIRRLFGGQDPAAPAAAYSQADLNLLGECQARVEGARLLLEETEVWLASSGPAAALRKLVLAQDAGSAITGAVRADYFAGTGPQAGELASKVKQGLQLWVLWPR
jgi:hypothetical protein